MGALFKLMFTAACLGALSYAACRIDLGGQTLVSHLTDVWRAPVVQEKVDKLKDGVKDELEKKVAEANTKGAKAVTEKLATAKRATEARAQDTLTDEDRDALAKVLEKATRRP